MSDLYVYESEEGIEIQKTDGDHHTFATGREAAEFVAAIRATEGVNVPDGLEDALRLFDDSNDVKF